MTRRSIAKRKLSKDILAALRLASRLQEQEVAERLVQALELMAARDDDEEDLCTAYLELVAPTPGKALQ